MRQSLSSLPTLLRVALFLFSVLLFASSCSRNSGAEDMLRTVPDNAGFVALADIQMILDHAGCADGKISPELKALCEDNEEVFAALISGEAGIAGDVASLFFYKDTPYVSAFVKDEDKALAWLRSIDDDVEKKGDGWEAMNGRLVLYDGQIWISEGSVDVDQARYFRNLKEEDSFLSVDYADRLMEPIADVRFFGKLDYILPKFSLREAASVRLGMSMLFNSPEFIAGTLTFSDGRATIEMNVLDGNFKPAKTSVKLAELSGKELSRFPGKGNLYAGIALSEEAVKLMTGNFGSMPGMSTLVDCLEGFSGSIIFGLNADQMISSGNRSGFLLQLSYRSAEEAKVAAEKFGANGIPVRTSDEYLLLNMGMMSGHIQPVAEKKLKGAVAGIVVDPAGLGYMDEMKGLDFLKLIWFDARKSGDSLTLSFSVETTPSSVNALTTAIEAASKYKK